MVVVSDGLENAGDAERALRAAREARLPLLWIAEGRPPPPTRVAEVLAPQRTLTGQRIQINVQLAGKLDRPLRVKVSAHSVSGASYSASSESDSAGRATVEFDAERTGAVLVNVAVEDPASGQTLDAWPDAAVIDVVPRATMLYAQGSTGVLARSLLRGGWALNVIPVSRLDAEAEALDGYRVVVLDDVAIADASPRFWNALVAAVRDRGVGLMVLGGERSFARGGYRESTLESVLPVISEPPALDQPAAIVFAVDKSGSMGQGSGGVDRFQMAQRAVLETAGGLSESDTLGLLVFDVAPRVLIPLGPASAAARALARDWLASPNGGTKLAPALEAAISELERSSPARRMLILVTDGFVEEAPLDGLRARLDRARIETIALAVGPDADVGALQRLVGADAGRRASSESGCRPAAGHAHRARTAPRTNRARCHQRGAASGAAVPAGDVAGLAGHLGVRGHPDQAGCLGGRTEPARRPVDRIPAAGSGRVVAVTCGLGRWTPQWLQWREWPRLAGGLADWSAGTAQGGALRWRYRISLVGCRSRPTPMPGRASPIPSAPSVDRQHADDARPVLSHGAGRPGPAAGHVARRRSRSLHLPGHRFHGTRRHLHLRRQRGENEAWGINPALEAWRSAGLRQPLGSGLLAQTSRGLRGASSDRSFAGRTGTRALLVGHAGRPHQAEEGRLEGKLCAGGEARALRPR